MSNQSDKFDEIRKITESVFEGLFGRNKQEKGNLNKQGLVYNDKYVTVYPDHSVEFNQTGSKIQRPLPDYSVFTNVDWRNGNLQWLATADFNAKAIQIKDGSVDRFIDGTWVSGEFKGRAFIDSTFGLKDGKNAYFNGKRFKKSVWQPSPYYFIDGTTEEQGTILGLKNIETLNQTKFKINIIAVIPGRKMIMELQNGLTHEVTVLKRLDERSSDFVYKVKNGATEEVFRIPLKWSSIRGNSEGEFINLTTLSNQRIPTLFKDTFKLPFNDPVVRLTVTDDTEYGKKQIEQPAQNPDITPADLSKKQESFELSNMTFLGIDKIPRKGGSETNLYFNFPTPAIQQGYKSVAEAVKKGWVNAYIKQVKSALDNNIIQGAPGMYPYLANLIGKDEDLNVDALDENLVNALKGLDSFLRYFVDNMVRRVRKTGKEAGIYDVEDTKGKELVKSRLKELLGLEKQPEQPGKQQKPKQGGAHPKAKFAESTDVRKLVSKILLENMKHF